MKKEYSDSVSILHQHAEEEGKRMYFAIYKNTEKEEYKIQCSSSKKLLEQPESGLELILLTESEKEAHEAFMKVEVKEK